METWGDKPKSQVDPATVDEEIAALIAAHEADPDAHLEVGESLQSHKASEIIDHVVGSVLSDKLSMTEIRYTTIFESFTGWDTVGYPDNAYFPGARFWTKWGDTVECSISSSPQVPSNFLDVGFDMLFECMARFDYINTNFDAWFGYLNGAGIGECWWGFQIRSGVLYCHYYNDPYTEDFEVEGVDLTYDIIFRVQFNVTTRTLSWYINGALVHEYTLVVGDYYGTDEGPAAGVKVTADNECSMYIGSLTFSRQI